jgi:hypothetical protein
VDALDLRVGDVLLRRDAKPVRVETVVRENVSLPVYNLHIAEVCNFAVGWLELLVHNRRPPMPRENPGIGTYIDPATGVNTRNGLDGTWFVQDPVLRNRLMPGASPNQPIPVAYRNGYPDFSPYLQTSGIQGKAGDLEIAYSTAENPSTRRTQDDASADWAYEQYLLGQGVLNPTTGNAWTASEIAIYRQQNRLTWHHHENVARDASTGAYIGKMQLVFRELNDLAHRGGRSIADDLMIQDGLTIEK